MNTEILCTIITSLVGIVTTCLSVWVKQSLEKTDERIERRQKESMLSLQMMEATLDLTEATANAVLGKTNNGNVERAYDKTRKARESYTEFERQVLAEELA